MKWFTFKSFSAIVFLLISCAGNPDNKKVNNVEQNDTGKIINHKLHVLPGRYGEISIAIDSRNFVTGVYEYYDSWDETNKAYTQVNVFYFMGAFKDGAYLIQTAWPTSDEKINGKLKLINESLSLKLDAQPRGYAEREFTKEDAFLKKQDQEKYWLQIRLVKSEKAKLYTTNESAAPLIGYLGKNDIVKVLTNNSDGWVKAEYTSLDNNSKPALAWLREEDLYGLSPSEW